MCVCVCVCVCECVCLSICLFVDFKLFFVLCVSHVSMCAYICVSSVCNSVETGHNIVIYVVIEILEMQTAGSWTESQVSMGGDYLPKATKRPFVANTCRAEKFKQSSPTYKDDRAKYMRKYRKRKADAKAKAKAKRRDALINKAKLTKRTVSRNVPKAPRFGSGGPPSNVASGCRGQLIERSVGLARWAAARPTRKARGQVRHVCVGCAEPSGRAGTQHGRTAAFPALRRRCASFPHR